MNAREAISVLNDHRLLMPSGTTNALIRIISRAACQNDADAAYFLWLIHWNPQQLAN